MRAAIIGASSESIHAIEEAKKQGIYTVALDGNPKAPGLAAADKGMVVDISDERATIEALKNEKIDFVLTVPIGRYLTTIGAVNDALGLPGISKKSASYCTDKYAFHKVLRGKGLRLCHCYLVNRDYLFPPNKITYPAILKPRFGSGSRAIHYITSEEQLVEIQVKELELDETDKTVKEKHAKTASSNWDATVQAKEEENEALRRDLCNAYRQIVKERERLEKMSQSEKKTGYDWIANNKRELEEKTKSFRPSSGPEGSADEDYVLEEAVPGEEYGVDAAMEGCNFEIVLLRRKINTPPPARQAVGYISVLPEEERVLYERVKNHLNKVVEALGLRECLFHADLMIKGKDIFVIELSARPSGHNLHNLFTPMATGIDVCREFLHYMSGRRHNFQPIQVKKMMIHYFDLENCFVHKIPDPKELKLPEGVVLRDWKCNIKTLDFLEPVTGGHSIMGRGYYILEAPKDSLLLQAAEMVNAQFEVS